MLIAFRLDPPQLFLGLTSPRGYKVIGMGTSFAQIVRQESLFAAHPTPLPQNQILQIFNSVENGIRVNRPRGSSGMFRCSSEFQKLF
jgi:hypothetical protein